jgi:hypothetical protein
LKSDVSKVLDSKNKAGNKGAIKALPDSSAQNMQWTQYQANLN